MKLFQVAGMCLVCACLSSASSLPIELRDEGEVAQVVLAAQYTVFISVRQFHNRAVADALRRAVVERGVRVLILCDGKHILERGGFIAGLSLLQSRYPLEVRVLRGVLNATLIVDGNRSVIGPLIAEPWTFGLPTTRLDLEPRIAFERAQRFWISWRRARPWTYQIKNPSFSSPGGAK